MSKRKNTAGFTVLEAVIAMGLLVMGAAGLVSLQTMGNRMNGDARVMTRAAAIGQDLVSQMQTWDYVAETAPGGRLANVNTANDADITDSIEDQYERARVNPHPELSALSDHNEDELPDGPWSGIPTDTLSEQGFVRYWNVAPYVDEDTGTTLGVKVAVIVWWDPAIRRNSTDTSRGSPRRIVLTTYVRDPGVTIN